MAKYKVNYYIEDYVVDTDNTDDFAEACESALAMDCPEFNKTFAEEEKLPEEERSSYYTEVRDAESGTLLIWFNTEGERGSDCPEWRSESATVDEYIR